MPIIPRNRYQQWLDEFRDKKLVKVLTGLRRSGKSTILEIYIQHLIESGVPRERILCINFEKFEFEALTDPVRLHEMILETLTPGQMTYVFLDEIQHVRDFEKVIDSLYVRDAIDIYITGSTAELLSSEIATRLTGRYVEINVLPLSFLEYASARGMAPGGEKRLFADYITYGGMPGAMEFSNGSSAQREYMESVFKTIVEKDVLKRVKRGRFLVERIFRYLAATVGGLTSAKRLADRLAEDANYAKDGIPSYNTVVSYLERLSDCFLFYKADRFDVCGGEHLKQINKYYLTDFGFKYYLLQNPTLELQQLVENVVFFELKRRRCKVSTGKVDDKEVDFVIQGTDGRIRYVQVATSVADEQKLAQELAAFSAIKDNHPKYLLTLDEIFVPDHGGIRTLNIIDFLLERCDLD